MPAASAAPDFRLAIIAALSSKRRKCTAEVFSSLVRSRSSSAIAYTGSCPATRSHERLSMPRNSVRRRARSAGSGYSISRCRLEVVAVRNQRIVCGQFLGDARGFEDALGAQHFLHLVAHGLAILETPGAIRAQMEPSRGAIVDHARADRAALAGVLLQRQQVGGRQRSLATSDSVGNAQQLQWRRGLAPRSAQTTLNLVARHRAVA